MKKINKNEVAEITLVSKKSHKDPFNEVSVRALFVDSRGNRSVIPGFWYGKNTWKIRFSSPEAGKFGYQTICSRTDDPGLHLVTGEITVSGGTGRNPLQAHGPLRISENKKYLAHRDGTPFLWLADTWWMGLCKRLEFAGFKKLAADRVRKGFNVIQIVAGLYPDMDKNDERGSNEGGFPWDKDLRSVNPEYFRHADRRIKYLADSGLVPCIVGCWGYYAVKLGLKKMIRHWEYIIARYGAYPCVWCLAGEAAMPFYLSKNRERDAELQRSAWTAVARFVKDCDGFKRPITIHPTNIGKEQLNEPELLDFDMLQTGHLEYAYSVLSALPVTVKYLGRSLAMKPKMPAIVGEVCYEGIAGRCGPETQRAMFWGCMLSGAAGHTYGANGIWQVNEKNKPYGPSPHGMGYGDTSWEDAAGLPGSAQIGISKKFLSGFKWWEFEPHPEWLDFRRKRKLLLNKLAAGIGDKVRIFYMFPDWSADCIFRGLKPRKKYKMQLFDPILGRTYKFRKFRADPKGTWVYDGRMPLFQDWIIIIKAA
jgi:hypothetical protein